LFACTIPAKAALSSMESMSGESTAPAVKPSCYRHIVIAPLRSLCSRLDPQAHMFGCGMQEFDTVVVAEQCCCRPPGYGEVPMLTVLNRIWCVYVIIVWLLHMCSSDPPRSHTPLAPLAASPLCSSCRDSVRVGKQMMCTLQVLFNDTIYRNIAYGRYSRHVCTRRC
jgi:hypothetical protein